MTLAEPDVHVVGADRFAEFAATWVASLVTASIETRGSCRLALSGGSTPGPVYRALGGRDDIDWRAVDVFWSDERLVPRDDPASNFRLATESLLQLVQPRRVVPMPVDLEPGEAASSYEDALGAEPLDVVLVGMGTDGHTASLFPGSEALADRDARVAATRAPASPHGRLTLTLRTLNEARAVVFLVAGAAKASRVADILAPDVSDARLPAALVRPASGRCLWLLDAPAGSRLPRKEPA